MQRLDDYTGFGGMQDLPSGRAMIGAFPAYDADAQITVGVDDGGEIRVEVSTPSLISFRLFPRSPEGEAQAVALANVLELGVIDAKTFSRYLDFTHNPQL